MKQELNTLKNEHDESVDLAEDVDLVLGPGRILKEARELCGLSEQDVANKLNFRTRLVQDIEVDIFDRSLPEAFNRGYLKNYAKLVKISEALVLNHYDQLAEAQSQCAGMQSFSKGTEKQAEHKMLMWITYLILAILFSATVVWWLQTPSAQPEPIVAEVVEIADETNTTLQNNPLVDVSNAVDLNIADNISPELSVAQVVHNETKLNTEQLTDPEPLSVDDKSLTSNVVTSQVNSTPESNDESATTSMANLVFTFSGDCWVNIYDATGERVAWGVKKSGYEMKISGQAPFTITLGKPELVQIDYNDVPIDMTAFSAGNIAKFTLPMVP